MSVKLNKTEKAWKRMGEQLAKAGAEMLATSGPYEVLKFRTCYGIGTIYLGKQGINWNPAARMAHEHIKVSSSSLAPVMIAERENSRLWRERRLAVLKRDGDGCFFCGEPMSDDMTLEHLVARAHGGPNHLSNIYGAHQRCNEQANILSAAEKVAIAIKHRRKA